MHVFDIIGPIMIGPSSSHTAGAARIGLVARQLLGEAPQGARIGLYGSFAATARGHGTDRTLAAGLLGLAVDDPALKDSLEMAKAQGVDLGFYQARLREAHPNTAVVEAWGERNRVSLRAASVGGGAIRVQELDGLPVNFSGEANTLILRHLDRPGAIAQVSRLLAEANINIATMQVFRERAGGLAVMALEIDGWPQPQVVEKLRALEDIQRVSLLRRI